ncbi:hypothetical protein ZHAS_00005515 [Anopheles sinensis]|uniref:Carbonic anhydrase n=1 Tax=Anopheles sinensis TaxID=74873 RepID=A0A084VJQ8_ANOSI|nr:hypothetical protein ZHAS_00005515 [Anopheles sinensis]
MSALCMSLLLACQPVVFGAVTSPDSFEFWGRKTHTHPNDIDYEPAYGEKARASTGAPQWSHSINDAVGPPNWSIVAPACAGLYQSPINIVRESTLFVKKKIPLDLQGLRNIPRSILVENEGYSVKFTPRWNGRTRPVLRGGPLKTPYVFEQLHFHWGPTNDEGSEHTLDGKQFPLEVHLVFYNGLYRSFDEAKGEVDGLAVLGFVYADAPNSAGYLLNRWSQFLPLVRKPKAEFELPYSKSFSLHSVIGDMGWPYYSYEGSLTTPPCLETVTWIVSAKRLAVTQREMSMLRSLLGFDGAPILQNYRPVQPVNNRRVFRY